MSTLKSSAEDLTLNADGSGNDVIIQSDGSTKANVTAEGDVGIGLTPSGAKLHIKNTNAGSQERGLYVDVSPEAGTSPNNLAMFMAGNGNITTPLVRIHHESPAADQLLLQCDTTGSNTVKFSVDEDGDVNLTGNLVIGTSGKGIDFSATSDASGMTSEVLDDYEEGTWTPGFEGFDGSAGSVAFSEQVGTYTKIGRLVTGHMRLTLTNNGDWSSDMKLTGLPFTPDATLPHAGTCEIAYINYSGGSVGNIGFYITSSETYLRVRYTQDNSAATIIQASDAADNSYFNGVFSYTTAS